MVGVTHSHIYSWSHTHTHTCTCVYTHTSKNSPHTYKHSNTHSHTRVHTQPVPFSIFTPIPCLCGCISEVPGDRKYRKPLGSFPASSIHPWRKSDSQNRMKVGGARGRVTQRENHRAGFSQEKARALPPHSPCGSGLDLGPCWTLIPETQRNN